MKCMNTIKQILITNDDGIASPGLHALAREIEAAGHEVTVAAPNYDASGVSASLGAITTERPIAKIVSEIKGFSGRAYALAAPPATCVLLAQLGAFERDFDLVVSGINDGMNTGRSVLHSGTVGAALAAQNFGLRGLAVSTARANPIQWQSAAQMACSLLPSMLSAASRIAINLNVPGLKLEEIKGLRWGALAPFNAIRSVVRENGPAHVTLEMQPPPSPPAADTDLGLTRLGFAALTSLHAGSEVWSEKIQPNEDFNPDLPLPAVTAGDLLQAARTYLQTS